MQTVIKNAIIHTGNPVIYNNDILIENGKISETGPNINTGAHVIDLTGKHIAPGFIDIQLNGGYQHYFSQDPDILTLEEMYQASCDFATPCFLPTLISAPHDTILKAIEATRAYMQINPHCLGMHLEGPFINVSKRGAHSEKFIRKPGNDELKTIIKKGKGIIKLMTIAPECFTPDQLQMLADSGIILSAGHSAMNYEQAMACFDTGIHMVTHLYNAMTQMGHRECGMVGAVFDDERVYAPIVLDGGHCHYAAARIAYQQKADKLLLLSDAAFLGRKKKKFDWEGLQMQMEGDFYRNAEGNLAGAAISIPEAMQNAVRELHIPLDETVQMVTSRVAKALKMDDKLGYIQSGYPAVFSVFNDDLTIYRTLII